MSQINFKSPELVVLGITILLLWVLSGLGLYGVKTNHRQVGTQEIYQSPACIYSATDASASCANHRQILRMYAFMLLVLILLQVSIVTTLYQNLDSSFLDEFVKLIRSLCVSPVRK